jgi:exonuclease-1
MLKHFGVTPIIVFDGALLPSKMGTETGREKYVFLSTNILMNHDKLSQTITNRRRKDALSKGNALLAEGKKSQARDCFVKGVDVTPEMAYQLIKVSLFVQCRDHDDDDDDAEQVLIEKR